MNVHSLQLVSLAVLTTMLAIAMASDIRSQRIPNGLVLAGVAAGLVLSLLPGGIGIASSAAGIAAGLAIFMPLHLLRGMGAGDVKLMAAVGAFAGWPGVATAALYSLVAGGVLSLAGALAARNLRGVFSNIRVGLYLSAARAASGRLPRAEEFPLSRQRMPYAVAIATGTAAWLIQARLA